MTLSLDNFAIWQKEVGRLREAREWLAHIGKTGRVTREHTDALRLSPAHCKAPQFSIAGQYHEGGQNYRDSPEAFDAAMKAVVLQHFMKLSAEAITILEKRAADALVKAEGEVAAVQAAIWDAKAVIEMPAVMPAPIEPPDFLPTGETPAPACEVADAEPVEMPF